MSENCNHGNNDGEVIIDVKNLHKNYGHMEVIKGVDLTVRKGEVICIIGPSGAGKSTMLRCLNGLEQASSGQIVVNGHDLGDPHVNIDQVREQVGMVFQHFNLFNNMSVIDNITLAPKLVHKETDEQAREHAMALLKPWDCRKGRCHASLVVWAVKSSVLPSQEHLHPTRKYFSVTRRPVHLIHRRLLLFWNFLKSINEQFQITIVIITHQMSVIREICNRVAIIEHGELVENGLVEDIFSHPKSKAARELILRDVPENSGKAEGAVAADGEDPGR